MARTMKMGGTMEYIQKERGKMTRCLKIHKR